MGRLEEAFLAHKAQLDVATGSNKPKTPEQIRKFQLAGIFLGRVKTSFNIGRIYYPGCSSESILESAFSRNEIVYLDKAVRRSEGTGHAVVGDYLRPPFPAGIFDAVFIQDIHLHEDKGNLKPRQAAERVFRVIKRDGIVIYRKKISCPEWQNEYMFLAYHPELKRINIPMQHPEFAVFQKTR